MKMVTVEEAVGLPLPMISGKSGHVSSIDRPSIAAMW